MLPWLILLVPAWAIADEYGACPLILKTGQFGPFDYQQSVKYAKQIDLVNRVHFTPDVETLKHGAAGPLASDLDYTIRAIPNHHRALDSISRLSIKLNRPQIPLMSCSADGFFERAMRFAPNDPLVHAAYGVHLFRWKKFPQAEEQLLTADRMLPNDGNIAYNLGLLYADLKQWDKAMAYAEKAYANGYRLPGLKNMLVAAGKWQPRGGAVVSEPTPSQASEPATGTSR
jgi:tetratricopeptide (TPR) repeat protein